MCVVSQILICRPPEYPGATEWELEALEARIGRELPWSYRQLLVASDGFVRLTSSIGRLLPAAAVDLYQKRDADLVRALLASWNRSYLSLTSYFDYDLETGRASTMDYHGDHLNEVIEITEDDDGITVLLNPLVTDASGEWEAWYFGPGRIQGAFRYQTLSDLVEDRLRTMRKETARKT